MVYKGDLPGEPPVVQFCMPKYSGLDGFISMTGFTKSDEAYNADQNFIGGSFSVSSPST